MSSTRVARYQYPANHDYYYGDPYSDEDYSVSRYRPRTRSVDYGYDDRRGYDYDRDYYSPRSSRSTEHGHSSRRRSHSEDRHRSSRHHNNRHHHHHSSHHHRSPPRDSQRRSAKRSQDATIKKKDAESDTKLHHAAHAAFDAAAVEAVRVRKQPGEWTGSKGIRVATAALSAAAIGTAQNSDEGKHSKRHLVEATVGGLLANRAVHGPRDDLRRRR